jgi:universal stress protein E
MKRFKNILVAVDTRLDEHPIVDEAAEIARTNAASLKIVDVVPEFPWTVRLVMSNQEHIRELIRKEKEDKLKAIASALHDKGISVETKVLMGNTSEEIIKEVLRGNHDLVLRVSKGSDSRRSGFFGNTGAGLLRKCPCAVWLVSPNSTAKFQHVLGCVDTSSDKPGDEQLNHSVYELASSVSQYHGGRFSIIHVWSIYGEQMIKGRMSPDDFDAVQKGNEIQVNKLMDTFLAAHGNTIQAENVHVVKGETPDVIPDFVTENQVDLVVMGTIARSGVAGLIMGNTAEQILNSLQCSVLAVKPEGFVCPIQIDE